jgi:hypothetical protein
MVVKLGEASFCELKDCPSGPYDPAKLLDARGRVCEEYFGHHFLKESKSLGGLAPELLGQFEVNVAFRFGGTPMEVAERGLRLYALATSFPLGEMSRNVNVLLLPKSSPVDSALSESIVT